MVSLLISPIPWFVLGFLVGFLAAKIFRIP
jgi:uncharacterized membrane protein YeaQ/YmgE (transglycosylase-associated protein family)